MRVALLAGSCFFGFAFCGGKGLVVSVFPFLALLEQFGFDVDNLSKT